MANTQAIQYMETLRDEQEAKSALAFLSTQDGLLGGRILPPSPITPSWRVQCFFEDDPTVPQSAMLPENRRVLILDSQRKALGILTKAS